MEKIRVSGKTKEEAITNAAIKLHTASDRLSYNVLVQGSNGIFGIGAKPWMLEAFVKEEVLVEEEESEKKVEESVQAEKKQPEESDEAAAEPVKAENAASEAEEKAEKPEKHHYEERRVGRRRNNRFEGRRSRGGYEEAQPAEEKQPERKQHEIKPISEEEAEAAKEKALEFITSVLSGMGMEVNTKCAFDHTTNELQINLEGPDMGLLIGKRGQTLDSLQYLASLVVNREHKDDYIRVKLDTEDYRKRREQTLRNLARNIAYKVKRNRKPVSLEPMNPYERRIIHAALQGDRYVTTKSEGEEPFRHIIIYLKKNREDK